MKSCGIVLLLGLTALPYVRSSGVAAQGEAPKTMESVKVTILSTMLVDHGIGECHCTGIEALFRLRSLTGLSRKTAVVGAVGATFFSSCIGDP